MPKCSLPPTNGSPSPMACYFGSTTGGVANIRADGSGVIHWHDGSHVFREPNQGLARAHVESWIIGRDDSPARRRRR